MGVATRVRGVGEACSSCRGPRRRGVGEASSEDVAVVSSRGIGSSRRGDVGVCRCRTSVGAGIGATGALAKPAIIAGASAPAGAEAVPGGAMWGLKVVKLPVGVGIGAIGALAGPVVDVRAPTAGKFPTAVPEEALTRPPTETLDGAPKVGGFPTCEPQEYPIGCWSDMTNGWVMANKVELGYGCIG